MLSCARHLFKSAIAALKSSMAFVSSALACSSADVYRCSKSFSTSDTVTPGRGVTLKNPGTATVSDDSSTSPARVLSAVCIASITWL